MNGRNVAIETVRTYNLDPKEVIAGLNGYYESDKRNGYIAVRRNDVEGPAYFTAALYLSALIEWLREDHDIFYYPGMDIPELVDTLFKAYDECKELRDIDINRKDAVKLSEENRELKESVCKDIMKYIRYEASRNGFELPEEIDGEPLTIKRVFHDLLELMRKRDTEIRNLNTEIKAKESGIEDLKEHIDLLEADLKERNAEIKEVNDQRWKDLRDIHSALGCYDVYDEVDDFLKAVKARAECIERLSRNAERETRKAVNDQLKKDTNYVADVLSTILEALGISKSNIVHLDVFGLKTKAIQRATYIKSEHDRYLEQLDKAAADYQALDKEYQELKNSQKSDVNQLIRDCCTKHGIIAPSRYLSDEACIEYLFSVIEQKIENYKLKLKDYILKDIKKHGYRYDSLETKSIEEIVDRIVTVATCTRNEWVDSEIRNLRGQIDRLKGLINAMNEEVKDM